MWPIREARCERAARTVQVSGAPAPRDGFAQSDRVPVDDNDGEQIEARDAVVLALRGAVSDLALTPDPQGVLQRMMRLALVETELGAPLHAGVERPVDHEQCALDAARSFRRGKDAS